MASNKETAKTVIDIDGVQAKQMLADLTTRAKELKAELVAAKAAGNTVETTKIKNQISELKLKQDELKRSTFDLQGILKDLNGTSLRDLTRAQSQLYSEIRQTTVHTKEEAAALKEKEIAYQRVKTQIDEVKVKMFDSRTNIQKFSDTVNKYWSVIAIGAAVVYEAFSKVGQFLDQWDQEAQGEKRLQTALKGREEIMPGLIKQAKDLQDATNIPHAVIEAQQGFLAAQGRTEDQIKKTMKAAIQMAAVVPGMDLDTAVKQLDSSYSGVLRGLNRLDPAFKRLSKEQLENGAAVDLMNEKYQGFAEARAQEGEGPYKSIGEIWKDISEYVGGFLNSVLRPMVPALKSISVWFRDLVNPITELHKQFMQWITVIAGVVKGFISLTIGIIAYSVAVNASTIAYEVYCFVMIKAEKIQKLFNATAKSNPIGLLVAVLVAAGTALLLFSQKMSESAKLMKQHNDAVEETASFLDREKIKTDQLVESAKNEKLSREDRLKALKELKYAGHGYLDGLDLENIATKKGADLLSTYNRELEKRIWLEGNAKELSTNTEEQRAIDRKRFGISGKGGTQGDIKLNDVLSKSGVVSNVGPLAVIEDIFDRKKVKDTDSELIQKQNALKKEEKQLLDEKKRLEDKYNTKVPGKLMPEMTPEEIAKAKEAATKAAEKAAAEKKKQYEKELKVVKEANDAENNLLEKKHNDSDINDATYEALKLKSELDFLTKKKALQAKYGQDSADTQNEFDKKLLDAQKKSNDLLKKAQEELAKAGFDNIKDAIDKEIAIENEAWTTELNLLKERFIIKQSLSEKEIELNALTQSIILEKTKAHNEKISNLDFAKASEHYEIGILTAAKEDDRWSAQKAKDKAVYDFELKQARDNKLDILNAEIKYAKASIANETEHIEKLKQIKLRDIGYAEMALEIMATLVDKNTALGKAIFIAQKGFAIAKIWVENYAANAEIGFQAAAMSIPTLGASVIEGASLIAANNINAILNTGLIAAQAISGITSKGKREGGDSGSGIGIMDSEGYEIAGVVHPNEYVIPAWMRGMPQIANFERVIEGVRVSRGYTSGGSVSPAGASGSSSSIPMINDANSVINIQALAAAINKLNKQLENPIVAEVALTGGTKSLEEKQKQLARIQQAANF